MRRVGLYVDEGYIEGVIPLRHNVVIKPKLSLSQYKRVLLPSLRKFSEIEKYVLESGLRYFSAEVRLRATGTSYVFHTTSNHHLLHLTLIVKGDNTYYEVEGYSSEIPPKYYGQLKIVRTLDTSPVYRTVAVNTMIKTLLGEQYGNPSFIADLQLLSAKYLQAIIKTPLYQILEHLANLLRLDPVVFFSTRRLYVGYKGIKIRYKNRRLVIELEDLIERHRIIFGTRVSDKKLDLILSTIDKMFKEKLNEDIFFINRQYSDIVETNIFLYINGEDTKTRVVYLIGKSPITILSYEDTVCVKDYSERICFNRNDDIISKILRDIENRRTKHVYPVKLNTTSL